MLRSKKAVSIVIALFMIFSMFLVGCSKNAEPETEAQSTPESTVTAAPTPEPTPLPEATLTWYFPSGDPLGDENLVYDEVNKILKERLNVTVDFKATSWGEYQEKMQVMMAASEEFDILFTADWFNNFQIAASKGNYLPLDDLLAKYAPKVLASMTKDTWKAVTLKGKIYAIPNQQIFARSANMEMPKGFVDKYGFDIRAVQRDTFKLEDLEPYLEKFKAGEPDKYSIELRWEPLSGYYGMEFLGGNNVPGAAYFKDNDIKIFNQFESPEFKSHLALAKKWVDLGYFKSKEIISKRDQGIPAGTMYGAWFGGTWMPGGEALASQAMGVPMVRAAVSESILNNSGILTTLSAISRTSKNPERAMMVLELMNSDEELFNLLMFGIEGKHYIKKTGKYIETVKDSKYVGVPNWLIATTFLSYIIEGQPEDVWAQHKKINEEAKPAATLGFTFDPTAVKTEVSNSTAVIQEYLEGLTFAILDIDKDYPVFIDKLKKAGSDKIIEEMQRQVDEWKAAQ